MNNKDLKQKIIEALSESPFARVLSDGKKKGLADWLIAKYSHIWDVVAMIGQFDNHWSRPSRKQKIGTTRDMGKRIENWFIYAKEPILLNPEVDINIENTDKELDDLNYVIEIMISYADYAQSRGQGEDARRWRAAVNACIWRKEELCQEIKGKE